MIFQIVHIARPLAQINTKFDQADYYTRDGDGKAIDHDFWVTGALETLGKLFRAQPLTHGLGACGATMKGAERSGMNNRRS